MTLQKHLLDWYDRNKRDLPWRRTRDPYQIWVSEVMLQQTQVTTVIPYYRRFLRRFPTLRALAKAKLDDVLKAWEGLGYYARARNLHRTAREIVKKTRLPRRQKAAGLLCPAQRARLAMTIPQTYTELRKLPGFGDYTAGAVASIAFGERVPAIDGNVRRVIARLFAIRERIDSPKGLEAVKRRVLELLSEKIGDFNQALMELGARVCTPAQPSCPACPVRTHCVAYKTGLVDRIPVSKKKAPIPSVEAAIGVVWKDGRLLIAQRKASGLLGGLWEFPGGKREDGEAFEQCVQREIKEETNVLVKVRRPLLQVRHQYTHFKVRLHVYDCVPISGTAKALECARVRWVRPEELARYAFPTANRKIIAFLRGAKDVQEN